MTSPATNMPLAPILYLPHGGGPMPLMGDPSHANMVAFWKSMAQRFPQPDAVVVISAHWEAEVVSVTADQQPALIYDYYNFPAETYQYQYPAPGDPALAQRVADALSAQSIPVQQDTRRGYDHGMFVPMMLMYPQATIPCVQVSLLNHLDAAAHIAYGKALASLRQHNILIIGSGMSFHNFTAMRRRSAADLQQSQQFDDWLLETCCADDLTVAQREQRLVDWEQAPAGRFCHPREEHLLPLHVCFGMAATSTPKATRVYTETGMALQVSAFLW